MPALSIKVIALTWAYNLVWMIVLGVVRKTTEGLLDGRGPKPTTHVEMVHRSLHPHPHLAAAGSRSVKNPGDTP